MSEQAHANQSAKVPWWICLFILIPFVFLMIGVVGICRDYDVMKRYVETQGTVFGGRIEYSHTSGRHGRSSTTYRPMVQYEYVVNGKRYEGYGYDRAGVYTSSYSRSKNVLEKYPVGSKCKVYHDPDKPEKSVLVKKMEIFFVIFAVIGGVGTAVLAFALPYAVAKSRLSSTGQDQNAQ